MTDLFVKDATHHGVTEDTEKKISKLFSSVSSVTPWLVLLDFQGSPFQVAQVIGDGRGVGDDHGDEGRGVQVPARRPRRRGRRSAASSRSAKRGVVVGRQAVQEEAGIARDQRRGRLELPRLALDQGAPGVVGLLGGRGPVAARSPRSRPSRSASASAARSVCTGADGEERAGAPPEVEVAPHAVGEPLLLAELGVQPRGELAAEDLIRDQQGLEIGVEPAACRRARPSPPPAGRRGGRAGGGGAPRGGRHRDAGDGADDLASPVAEQGVERLGEFVRGRRRPPRPTRRGRAGTASRWNASRSSSSRRGDGLPRRRRRWSDRVVVAVERPQQGAVGAGVGAVALGAEGGEGLAPEATEFGLGEARVAGGGRRPGRGSASRWGVRHCRPTYEPSQPHEVERLRAHPLGRQGDLLGRCGWRSPRRASRPSAPPARRGPARAPRPRR